MSVWLTSSISLPKSGKSNSKASALQLFGERNLKRGVEPDSCFYIQRVERIRGIEEVDLLHHPAPYLVIEVEVTNPVLEKLPIWARFGVPEVWRVNVDGVGIMRLEGNDYNSQERSETLPYPLRISCTQH